MDRDIAALVGSRMIGGNSIIKLLNKGEKFKFPKNDSIMIYCGRGWYIVEETGRKWRTGIRTGVVTIPV